MDSDRNSKGFIGGFECSASGRDDNDNGGEDSDVSKDSNLVTISPEENDVDSEKPVSISSRVSLFDIQFA